MWNCAWLHVILLATSIVCVSAAFDPPAPSQALVRSPKSNPTARWQDLLGDALWFYDVQRSGVLPSDNRVAWRNDSALQDGSDVGRNLSGGFFDAGDYIKATLPLCWTLTSLSWGASSFGAGYESSAQTPYLDATLRWGLDWLQQAYDEEGQSLVALVGNPDVDNNYWGGDQGIPTPRPSYVVSRDKPGTELFASCAAAFASAAFLYSGKVMPVGPGGGGATAPASIRDDAYAATLLGKASTLFNLAQTATPHQKYQVAVPEVGKVYPSTDVNDDLVLGAAWVAAASGDAGMAATADGLYRNPQGTRGSAAAALGGPFPYESGVLNWDQKSPALPVLLRQLAELNSSFALDANKYANDAQSYLDPLASGKMARFSFTSGGLSYWQGDSDSASLQPSLSSAALATIFSNFSTTASKRSAYTTYAQGQLDYVLGKNPANVVYVVGVHPNSAMNPHSAMASGGNDIGKIDSVPPLNEGLHTLYGAVVGGPDESDRFYDLRSDYVQNEVALDYNPSLATLCAYRIAQGAALQGGDPFYVGLTAARRLSTKGQGGGGGLSKGAGIAIAVIVLVVFFSLTGFVLIKCRGRIRNSIRLRRMGL